MDLARMTVNKGYESCKNDSTYAKNNLVYPEIINFSITKIRFKYACITQIKYRYVYVTLFAK